MTEPATAPTTTEPQPSLDPQYPLAFQRLLLCASLFAAWMAYLAFLVFTTPEVPTGPRVLSRPQALTSTFDVVAAVKPGEDTVTVKRVLYSTDSRTWDDKPLRVSNLARCGSPRGDTFQPDITTPGEYLLLLQLAGEEAVVVPIPPSPGLALLNPRAYAATPDILAQYQQVQKPK